MSSTGFGGGDAAGRFGLLRVKQAIVEKMDMDVIIHVGLPYLSCVLLPGADSLEEGVGWEDAGDSYFLYQSLLV